MRSWPTRPEFTKHKKGRHGSTLRKEAVSSRREGRDEKAPATVRSRYITYKIRTRARGLLPALQVHGDRTPFAKQAKRDSSTAQADRSQERTERKKSACFARNDGENVGRKPQGYEDSALRYRCTGDGIVVSWIRDKSCRGVERRCRSRLLVLAGRSVAKAAASRRTPKRATDKKRPLQKAAATQASGSKAGWRDELAATCRGWSEIFGARRGMGWGRSGRILRGRRR